MLKLFIFSLLLFLTSCVTVTNTTHADILVNTDKGVALVCNIGLVYGNSVVDASLKCSGTIPLSDDTYLVCKNISIEYLARVKEEGRELNTDQYCEYANRG